MLAVETPIVLSWGQRRQIQRKRLELFEHNTKPAELNQSIDTIIESKQEEIVVNPAPELKECTICYNWCSSQEYLQLLCGHQYCKECIVAHALNDMSSGRVTGGIRCLDKDCGVSIPPSVLSELLSKEDMEKFFSLTLQVYLRREPDTVYCPTCHLATIGVPNVSPVKEEEITKKKKKEKKWEAKEGTSKTMQYHQMSLPRL
eukprot:TRINITY_DN4209_c0_g1_i1.p1 TRINITY_DN4209_c0_g1~~TRINITY_DN4209_c0_g1_i1.p1  ORF type:complete len:202 (+),score=36.57 TRINITY_DN4209_c0_g1_i1:110-715(+)